ncbi:unnamed protein product [Chrysoparadoxa australica]
MRTVAMKLHTRDQAPKEGEKEAEKGAKPLRQMEPTRGGYLQFLVDSRLVYAAFEGVVQKTAGLERFIDTGLERTSALDKDIRWMVEKYPELSKPSPTQAAVEYTELLEGLSLPAFMCHFYNHYFAHTAGGLQIGKMVSSKCLDGTTLEFYKWDGDVKPILAAVRGVFSLPLALACQNSMLWRNSGHAKRRTPAWRRLPILSNTVHLCLEASLAEPGIFFL